MPRTEVWDAERIITALVGRYWINNTVMVEWEVDGGRADFVIISKARYLTDMEIKVTADDRKKDGKKIKWTTPLRPHVSRFYYCVPEFLVDSAPPNLPEGVGILAVGGRSRPRGDWVGERRKAQRLKGAKKISAETIQAIYKAAYYRFWRQTLNLAWKERQNDSM